MREDLPKEFKITSIVDGDEWYKIWWHNTRYTISNKMLELVGWTSVVEFKAWDRVRFKSLEECEKIPIWNSAWDMDYLAWKEFTITETRKSYFSGLEIIPDKVFEWRSWYITDTIIEHNPKERITEKNIKTFASTVEPREWYKWYPEYDPITVAIPKFDVPDYMRTATGVTYADKYSMPNPYGTSVCDAIDDASRYLSKADYGISQEYFDKKHSKKEYKKRIIFSKVQ